MLKEQIEQLKMLLAEMGNPNPLEYSRIMEEFNEYRDFNNPNKETLKIPHRDLMYLIADKFRNFEFQRQLRDKSKNLDIKTSTGAVVGGLFYEMVATIKKYDPEGWANAGFDISNEEMRILKEHRNVHFHVPDDTDKLVERIMAVKSLEGRLFEITLHNSGALLKYMFLQREQYPEIEQMLETAFLPSRAVEFLYQNYKPDDQP